MTSAASTATALVPPPTGDFPTWLPPMLVKELRQGMRTRGFVVVFIAFQALMALLMMGAVVGPDAAMPGVRAGVAATINGFFWTLLTVQLLLVTPARALGSLQLEMESRSIDLLMLTRLSAWRIVIGKWASLVAQAALLLVAMLPYGIVRYFAGSADLVSDAKTCGALLAGCAVLTAAGLWSSGLSKLLRIVFVIIGVFVGQMWRPIMMGFGIGGGMGPTFVLSRAEAAVWCFDGALLLGFFLVAAVRRIAPPAENHALLARGLPLLALLAVPVWAQFGALSAGTTAGQLVFVGCFVLLACAVELANARLPMAVHVRPWAVRGIFGRFAGRFALPGWPSALLFTALVAGLAAVAVMLLDVAPPFYRMRAAWLAALALDGLAFPVLALALFKRTAARSAASLYGLTLGAMSVLAATVASMAVAFPFKYAKVFLMARVLPVTGFWLSLGNTDLTAKAMVGQAVLMLGVLGAAAWQMRGYWRHVAHLEARERSAKP